MTRTDSRAFPVCAVVAAVCSCAPTKVVPASAASAETQPLSAAQPSLAVAVAPAGGCDRAAFWSDGQPGRTWDEARAVCQRQGGDLASIHGPADRRCADQVLLDAGAPLVGAWIGLREIAAEGRWQWSDATPTDYLPWLAGEPNDDSEGPGDCGHVWLERDAQWNDIPCWRTDVTLLCRVRR